MPPRGSERDRRRPGRPRPAGKPEWLGGELTALVVAVPAAAAAIVAAVRLLRPHQMADVDPAPADVTVAPEPFVDDPEARGFLRPEYPTEEVPRLPPEPLYMIN